MNCRKKSNKVIYFSLFVLLAIPMFTETISQYFLFVIILFFLIISNRQWKLYLGNTINNMSVYFLITWVLGVCIGIYRGNEMSEIFRNFAGMVIYLLYFFLRCRKINFKCILRIVYFASIIASIEMIVAYYLYSHGKRLLWPLTNIHYNRLVNSVDSSIKVLPFVLLSVSLWNILHFEKGRSVFIDIFLFALATISIIFTTDLGGSLFGYITIFGTIIFISPISNKKSIKYWIISSIVFIIVVVAALYYELKTGLFLSIFSATTLGNDKRLYQFQLVFERFKLLGNGLGSHFKYVYLNRNIDSYGIEVSYLNLIDKFGIFSFPMLWYFAYSYCKPVLMLIKKQGNNQINTCIIGLMGYLFVAAGNPVIFAPYNVLLHILSLLMLNYENNMIEKNNGFSIKGKYDIKKV